MATATRVKTTETKVVEVDAIQLTLTESEAATLRQVLGNVGGEPSGPRGIIDGIFKALKKAGVDVANHNVQYGASSLYFVKPGREVL